MATRVDKDKGVNVQVLLRCRYFDDLFPYSILHQKLLYNSCLHFPFLILTWCSNVLAGRPFNEEEKRSKSPQVLSCYDQRREVTVCQNIASKQIDRTFTFDKVRLSSHPLRLKPWLDSDCESYSCKIGQHWQITGWNCILWTRHGCTFLLQTLLEYWENPRAQYEISIIVFLSELFCFCLVIPTLSCAYWELFWSAIWIVRGCHIFLFFPCIQHVR